MPFIGTEGSRPTRHIPVPLGGTGPPLTYLVLADDNGVDGRHGEYFVCGVWRGLGRFNVFGLISNDF